jgi:hypothetical protein
MNWKLVSSDEFLYNVFGGNEPKIVNGRLPNFYWLTQNRSIFGELEAQPAGLVGYFCYWEASMAN